MSSSNEGATDENIDVFVPSDAHGDLDEADGRKDHGDASADMSSIDMSQQEVCESPPRPTFNGQTYYLALNGTDPQDCSGGTKQNPWGSWVKAKDCLGPGDTLYLAPGRYEYNTPVFGGRNKLELPGAPQQPIRVAPDPDEPGEVVFFGSFSANGQGYMLEGMRFERDPALSRGSDRDKKRSAVQVGGSHIWFHKITMHGDIGTDQACKDGKHWDNNGGKCERMDGQFDCLKILGGDTPEKQVRGIHILDSDIGWCREDCVDVTGAIGVVYDGNTFHGCRMVQVKGGVEDVRVEGNVFYRIWETLTGAGMSCPNRYCGGGHIPELPVSERYVGKNVVVRNNLFVDIGWTAISAAGWRDVLIEHNTFYKTGRAALSLKGGSFDFYDDAALDYCKRNNCSTCNEEGSKPCARIGFGAKNVRFRHNIVHTQRDAAIWDQGARAFEATQNVYFNEGNDVDFWVGRDKRPLSQFAPESGSWQVDPQLRAPSSASLPTFTAFEPRAGSPAIDAAQDSQVCQDLSDRSRGEFKDVGALEATE